ncbi:Gfo/Idh/MocA family protein [Pumilibacter intestinalis]|uniref:Gfo/Idh/MocA family protein n=1 Tax=Pumilibacter intestinalis TaxID=2941511 RepID=UPI0020421F81|nr:Gfo/Idh/MocA family oxidoreductase [Pumilibacter intestinalis]
MRKTEAVAVGCGDRTTVYCEEGAHNLGLMKIVAAVDPDEVRLKYMRDRFGVPPQMCFKHIDDVLKMGKIADCVINGTMDELHKQTAIPFLRRGYDMLLEKPIVNNRQDLAEILAESERNKSKLMICHVLRYAPFYKKIKRLISDGEIGEIVNINTSERVGVFHSSVSYIRGKWNSEEKCGSSLLLAKCCHDIDLLCWLNNNTVPEYVYSEGGRNFIVPEKAPEGAGTRCLVDCPEEVRRNCIFDVQSMYLDNCKLPWYPWQCTGKDWREVTHEEKVDSLKTYNPHGACAYKIESDLADHQQVTIRFANGSTANHTLLLACMKAGRRIWVTGTRGELEGNADDGKLYLRKYDKATSGYTEQVFDFADTRGETGGHFGGDKGLVQDFCALLRGEKPSVSCTAISDSVNGHLAVYCADESLKTKRPVVFRKLEEI